MMRLRSTFYRVIIRFGVLSDPGPSENQRRPAALARATASDRDDASSLR